MWDWGWKERERSGCMTAADDRGRMCIGSLGGAICICDCERAAGTGGGGGLSRTQESEKLSE